MNPAFRIYVDFYALTTSDTRGDIYMMHPSIATAFNETKIIRSIEDQDALLAELADDLHLKILTQHHMVRTVDANNSLITSNVQISKLVTMWCFIQTVY